MMMDVFLKGFRKDQDVIEVNKDKFIQHVPYGVVDQGLEDGWGIGQTEEHHS